MKGGKFIKKIIFIVVVFMIGVISVDARVDKIYSAEKIDGMYIRKISNSGKEVTRHGGFIRRVSDNQFVYCVEPFVDLVNNHTYDIYDSNYTAILNITDEIWNRISLIAYYGYQYGNHTEDYWYYITQIMIWRTVYPEGEFYFTDTLGGDNNINKYAKEIAEIESLVNNHYLTPEFEEIKVNQGETKRFVDKNNVLSMYEVIDNTNVVIEGNELVINGENIGIENIELRKNNDIYEEQPLVYSSDDSQKVLSAGYIEPVSCMINIEVIGYTLKIIKVDALTGDALKMDGIKFNIYDANTNEFIMEVMTDDNGEIIIDNLSKGSYKIKEIDNQEIPGYEINEKEIYFEITGEEEIITVEFPNNPVLGALKVLKVNEDGNSLAGVTFGLYQSDGALVDIVVTDESGIALFENLQAGTYQLKELATIDGYLLDETVHEIELKLENNKLETVTIKLVNYQPKGSLEIIKVDTNNNPLPETEFVLYDSNRKEIKKAKTNSEGKIIVDNLLLGKYYLEEITPADGYQLLDDIIEFEINNNKEVITITVTNEKIDIDIPDTEISMNIDDYILEKRKNLLRRSLNLSE